MATPIGSRNRVWRAAGNDESSQLRRDMPCLLAASGDAPFVCPERQTLVRREPALYALPPLVLRLRIVAARRGLVEVAIRFEQTLHAVFHYLVDRGFDLLLK